MASPTLKPEASMIWISVSPAMAGADRKVKATNGVAVESPTLVASVESPTLVASTDPCADVVDVGEGPSVSEMLTVVVFDKPVSTSAPVGPFCCSSLTAVPTG